MLTLTRKLATLAVRRYSLAKWNGLNPPQTPGRDWGVTLPSRFMADVFDRMLPAIRKNPWRKVGSDAVATYLHEVDESALRRVRAFFELFQEAIAIEDLTRGSFALSANFSFEEGRRERTSTGTLVSEAKPYDEAPTSRHRAAAVRLRQLMSQFLDSGCLGPIDAVVAVPPSDPRSPYALPGILAATIAAERGIEDVTRAITKLRATRPLKNLSKDAKAEELAGSIRVDGSAIAGRTVLVVDDLYQSGTTLNFVALELIEAGAEDVFGFAAVKTMRNTDNQPIVVDDDEDFEVPF